MGRQPREETAAAAVVLWFYTAGVALLPQPEPALCFILYLILRQKMGSLTSPLTAEAERLGIWFTPNHSVGKTPKWVPLGM